MNRSITALVQGMRDYRTAFLPLAIFAVAAAGISPGTIRMSVGLEATEDVVNDVLAALDAAEPSAV